MIQNSYFLPIDKKPEWLVYPYGFKSLIEWNIFEILNWRILNADESIGRLPGLAERYPSRVLFPFAGRRDNDDIACWSKGGGDKVFIVHDFASSGWEQHETLDTFGSWLRFIVDDFIDWEPLPEPDQPRV